MMRLIRIFGLVVAFAMFTALLLSGSSSTDWRDVITGPRGWLAGIAAGITLAWLLGVEWRSLPDRARYLALVHRKNLGWSLVAAGSLAYLTL